MRVELIFKKCPYETNYFYIKNLENFWIQYCFAGKLVSEENLFRREAGFGGKLVSQGSWFRRETGFAGTLVWQGNWFRKETGFSGKLVWQGKWFRRENGLAGKLVSQELLIMELQFCNIFLRN